MRATAAEAVIDVAMVYYIPEHPLHQLIELLDSDGPKEIRSSRC